MAREKDSEEGEWRNSVATRILGEERRLREEEEVL